MGKKKDLRGNPATDLDRKTISGKSITISVATLLARCFGGSKKESSEATTHTNGALRFGRFGSTREMRPI